MTTSTSRPRRRSSEVFATTAQLSQNFLALMASGAVIAMAGLLSGPVPQSLALAAAGIIAPAFEPVAKLAIGLVRGNWYVIRRAHMPLAVVHVTGCRRARWPICCRRGWAWGARGTGCQRRSGHPSTAIASR
jgi:hypothetical protein